MLDPFTTLAEGEPGADVLMDPGAVGDDYHNDDLRLVRCYREDDHLRAGDTNAFLRRLRGDTGDPIGEIPAGATPSEEVFSPLLAIDIPPEFARLDDRDAANVVTRVLALDIELDKLDLLAKLGSAVSETERQSDVERLEEVLDRLAGFQHVPGVEALVEQRLF